ncbi:MAG: 50S ribosomal protein L23 [Candidatus Omnitrophota bacterium]
MAEVFDIIKTLIRTEKGTVHEAGGKYQFWVNKGATKPEIKKAVEKLYKVKVERVNAMVVPGKLRRVRTIAGKTPDWKKAIVTLKEGNKIEVT